MPVGVGVGLTRAISKNLDLGYFGTFLTELCITTPKKPFETQKTLKMKKEDGARKYMSELPECMVP